MLERGITVRKGRRHLDAALPEILEDAAGKLSAALRLLLEQLKLELEQLATRLEEAETLIQLTAQNSDACRRLDAIPGIGPVTATALIAAIGNGAAFHKGRELAAWLRLVPREHSTGAAGRSCSASTGAATPTCGGCSCRVPAGAAAQQQAIGGPVGMGFDS